MKRLHTFFIIFSFLAMSFGFAMQHSPTDNNQDTVITATDIGDVNVVTVGVENVTQDIPDIYIHSFSNSDNGADYQINLATNETVKELEIPIDVCKSFNTNCLLTKNYTSKQYVQEDNKNLLRLTHELSCQQYNSTVNPYKLARDGVIQSREAL